MPSYKKKPIPQNIRYTIWVNHFGNTLQGVCYCCNIIINYRTFQAGHIIAEKLGGLSTENNLLPICKSCNCSMGIMNLFDFKKKYFESIQDEPGNVNTSFILSLFGEIMNTYNIDHINDKDKLMHIKKNINIILNEKINNL